MDKNSVKLSVCLPTYNRFEYLRVTIDHLLKELEKVSLTYEIIIGDGGSTDNTIDYVSALDGVDVFNGGLVDACKINFDLLKRSHGKYILLMTDKLLINIDPVLKGLEIMEGDVDFGLLSWKTSLFKSRVPFKASGVFLEDIVGTGDLCLFRRDDAMKYWVKNYNCAGCLREFPLRLLFSGKFVAYTKEISGYEIKFRHYDYLHINYRYQKNKKNSDIEKLKERLNDHMTILEEDIQKRRYERIRVKVINSIFKFYQNLYQSDTVIRLLLKFFPKEDQYYPSIPDDKLPIELGPMLPGIFPDNALETMKQLLGDRTDHSEKILSDVEHYLKTVHNLLKEKRQDDEWKKYFVDQTLDCRVKIKVMDKLYEWLYENSSSYLYKCRKYNDDLYLMQKLPDHLVLQLRRLQDQSVTI